MSETLEEAAERLCNADYATKLAKFKAGNSSASMSVDMEYAWQWKDIGNAPSLREHWLNEARKIQSQ